MHALLYILSFLAGLLGLLTFGVAKTSIHEIQAAVLLLISAVLLAGAAVVGAVHQLRRDVLAQRTAEPPTPASDAA
jgi:hypothetical protein